MPRLYQSHVGQSSWGDKMAAEEWVFVSGGDWVLTQMAFIEAGNVRVDEVFLPPADGRGQTLYSPSQSGQLALQAGEGDRMDKRPACSQVLQIGGRQVVFQVIPCKVCVDYRVDVSWDRFFRVTACDNVLFAAFIFGIHSITSEIGWPTQVEIMLIFKGEENRNECMEGVPVFCNK